MTNRRAFIRAAGATGVAGLLGGCVGGNGGGGDGGDGGDGPTPEPYGNGELNFLMSPSEPQDFMERQYQPVKEHLNSELGVPVKLTYSRNYSGVLQALDSGTGDVAETGPFAAAIGVRAEKADVVLQRYAFGSWDYRSVIVTKADSDVQSVTDLRDKRIAFADRLSASGALFPLYMLKQAGLNIGNLPEETSGAEFQPSFSSHSAAFEALANGQADAAGVGDFITLNDNRELKDGFRYVDTYDGIPRAPIVTSPRLGDTERQDVVDAFTNAPEKMYLGADGKKDADDEENPDDLWFSDVRPANADTYQPVIDVAKDLNIQSDLLDK